MSGENRLWFVELELHGACDEVRLDCGADGETRLHGPFSSGEDRHLTVPVPVRSPLGADGLALVPLPRAELLPAGASGTVRVVAWSAAQPAARLAQTASALLLRPRPPIASAAARAGAAELVLVLAAGGFVLALRRRLVACVALALGAGLLAFFLARGRTAEAGLERVLEWEAGGSSALSVTAAVDRLALPREGLEVVPEGQALVLALEASGGSGDVRAARARLAGLESAAVPPLDAQRNGGEPLSEVWTRDAAGEWRAHGAWPHGAPLPPPAGSRADPPGWLASALPPGRSVLVARSEGGGWLRCLGFALE